MRLLQVGHAEPLKAGVHGVGLIVSAVCAGYSLAALFARRRVHGHIETHLAVNTVVYTALSVWELHHVRVHLAEARLGMDEGDG